MDGEKLYDHGLDTCNCKEMYVARLRGLAYFGGSVILGIWPILSISISRAEVCNVCLKKHVEMS